jgi:polyhydroxyalkanoate synthase subunit PhaE
MENKTFFDAWLETQKEMTSNWAESNRKLQDAVKSGTVLKDGAAIYQEWLAKQAEITKSATEQAAENVQSQAAENTETFKNVANGTTNLSDVYNNWMNAQKDIAAKAFENFRSFGQPMMNGNSFVSDSMKQFQNFQQQWINNTQNWASQSQMQQWMAPFQQWTSHFNNDTTKDAWSNMTNMTAAYTKFYELWAPAFKNMQTNPFNTDWSKSFQPEAFREMIDRSMAWMSPVQTKELFQQFQNWTEVANNYGKHVYQQFAGSIPENMKHLTPFLLFGQQGDSSNQAVNLFAVYQRAISPLVRLFNPGKEAELNDIVAGGLEKFSNYGQKLAELQQHIYTTGAKTWENFLAENSDQMKKGADLSNIQEVFQKWTSKSEEAYIALFRSDEYSKIQAELLDLSLDLRQRGEKIAETVLGPLPVVLRSEADELHTTIYELRKRIHALEKQVGAEAKEEVKETKPSANSSKKKATA